MIYLQLNSWFPMWLPVSMKHLFNSLQYIFLVSLHPALLKQMQCFYDICLFITESSCNEKNESTVCSTACTTATPILQRVRRPVLYFSLEYILALCLLPLEEKKLKLHDLIIRSSKKLPKLQKLSFENWIPADFCGSFTKLFASLLTSMLHCFISTNVFSFYRSFSKRNFDGPASTEYWVFMF